MKSNVNTLSEGKAEHTEVTTQDQWKIYHEQLISLVSDYDLAQLEVTISRSQQIDLSVAPY